MRKFLESNKNIIYGGLILYWLILFIATTLPGRDVPDIGVGDKYEHSVAYFVLAVLLMLTMSVQNKYPSLKRNPEIYTLILGALYGVADELHQLLVPGRSCDFFDWLADFGGTVIAIIIVKYIILRQNTVKST